MHKRGRATGRCFHDPVCLGLLACSVGLHAQSADNNPKALIRVHGSVVNAVTHIPIPRALLTSADQRMAVMTDDKGRFEFDVNLVPGNASGPGLLRGEFQTPYIVVKKPGFLPPTLPTPLPLDDLAALKTDLRLQLMPEASISGNAVGAIEEVPTGLNVQLLHRQLQDGTSTWTTIQSQQVDAGGRFRFGGLVPGDYKIVTGEWVEQIGPMEPASKPVAGFPPQFYPSGATEATAAVLHLGGGQNAVADLNLRGAKYYQVEVPIASNTPASTVQVQVASENGPVYTLGFNPKSQKVEGMLPDGVYHLTVVDVGDVARPGAIQDIRAGTGDLTVAGKPAHGTGIALLPAATIAVNVREDFTGPDPAPTDSGSNLAGGIVSPPAVERGSGNGNPVAQIIPQVVDVSLGPADRGYRGSNFGFVPAPQPDPDTGELKFNGVPPGRYRVQINARRGYVASATANGVDLLRNPLLVESSEPSAISIILRDDSGTITGTVSGTPSRSRPAFSSYVMAFPMGDGQAAQPAFGSLQGDGKFTVPNIVPGRYLVVAGEGQPPSFAYRSKDAMKAHESQGAIVDVTAGQTVTTSLKPLPSKPEYADKSEEVDD